MKNKEKTGRYIKFSFSFSSISLTLQVVTLLNDLQRKNESERIMRTVQLINNLHRLY